MTDDFNTQTSDTADPAVQMVTPAPRPKPFLRIDNPVIWVIGIGGLVLYYVSKNRKQAKAHKVIANPVTLGLPTPQSNPGRRFKGFCGMGEGLLRNPTGDLFTKGNTKLGKGIWAFSLPRVKTCPGMSPWCSKNCYMDKLEKVYSRILPMYERNLAASKKPSFVTDAIAELRRHGQRGQKTVRVHVDGDFYSVPYIEKWTEIVKSLAPEGWKFYAYTKSWRVPKLLPALNELRKQPNMVMRASTDESTDKPPAGWMEAGIESCKSHEDAFTCHFYDNSIHCDTCRACLSKGQSIILKSH